MSSNTRKIIIISAVILFPVILISLIVFIFYGYFSVLFTITSIYYIAPFLSLSLGIDILLARIISVIIIAVGYFYGIRLIVRRRSRNAGLAVILAIYCCICGAMYFTQGSFSRFDGRALQYYFRDERNLIVLRPHSGTDARTGKILKNVTPDIISEYRIQQNQAIFNPDSGEPLRRFYRSDYNTIELFPKTCTYHPSNGMHMPLFTHDEARSFGSFSIAGKDEKWSLLIIRRDNPADLDENIEPPPEKPSRPERDMTLSEIVKQRSAENKSTSGSSGKILGYRPFCITVWFWNASSLEGQHWIIIIIGLIIKLLICICIIVIEVYIIIILAIIAALCLLFGII